MELQNWLSNAEVDAKTILDRKTPKIGRSTQTDILTLAFLFRINGNKKYKRGIEIILNSLFKLPEWDKQGMLKLDGSMRSYGVAIAYDWLYYDWSSKFKKEIENQLLIKTFKAYEKSVENNIWWLDSSLREITYYNNHNSVCNTGPLLAALALVDNKEYQKPASEIISTALNSMYSGTLLGLLPDGAWDEGPGYYGYSLYHLIDGLASVMNTLKNDYKFLDQQGLQKTAAFLFHVNGSAGAFNYGDGTSRKNYAPYLYWIADNVPNNKSMGARYYQFSNEVDHRASVKDLLYFNTVYRDTSQMKELPLDATFGQLELATMRSSWDNDNASFIAVKGSKGSMSHGNADVGHVIFQSQGENWFVDLGGEPYSSKYFSYDTDRYFYYRAMPEGHNTMVINPSDKYQQEIDIYSRITETHSSSKQAYSIVDLNPAYHKHTLQNVRAVGLTNNRQYGLVQDELSLRKPSDFWSFFHTYAEIEIINDGSEVILSQNGKNLMVKIISKNKNLKFQEMQAMKLPETPKASGKEYNNSNIRKLAIHAKNVSKMAYAVIMIPLEDATQKLNLEYMPMKEWGSDLVYELPIKSETLLKDNLSIHNYTKLNVTSKMISLSQNTEKIKMKYLLDGNPNTYWETAIQSKDHKDFKPQYLTVTFSKSTAVSAVGIKWHTGYQRLYSYEIEVSVDGVNYEQVLHGLSCINNHLQKNVFDPKKIKSVRIKCNGTMRGKSIIDEIAVYE